MRLRKAAMVVAALVVATAALGREWMSEKYRCAITYPDEGWELRTDYPLADAVFAVSDGDGTRTLAMVILKESSDACIDDAHISGIEKGVLMIRPPITAAKRIRGRKTTVGGLPAYELLVRYSYENGYNTVMQKSVVANSCAYLLDCIVIGGDPSQDPELMGILTSFRFTSPPVPPEAPEKPAPFAERMGELAAYLLMGVLALAVLKRVFVGRTKKPA